MFRLLPYFSIASAIAIAIALAVIALVHRQIAVGEMVEAQESENVALARTLSNVLWPKLGPFLSATDSASAKQLRDDPQTADFEKSVKQVIEGLPVLKIKIYNLRGMTVYSTNPDEIGESHHGAEHFRRAAQKDIPVSLLSHHDDFVSTVGHIYDISVVESYVPIAMDNGRVAAVIELYSDVTVLSGRIRSATFLIIGTALAVLSILYVVLFLIVRHAHGILRTQYTTLRDQEEELRDAHDKLKKANTAKTDFLATVSHEIRTPLNAIVGFSEMLQREVFGPLGNDRYREYAKDLHNSGMHLLDLINDILDLSRISAGRHELTKEPMDVGRVVEECSAVVTERATRKGIAFGTDIPNPLEPLIADRRAIKQILINLLGNAVKFTPDGGSVDLRVNTADGFHVFEIADTGEGIPADLLPTLTDPFTRAKGTPYESQEGTGLGLAIVASLVDLHGGMLNIESQVGDGTTVTVRLPSVGKRRGFGSGIGYRAA